MADRGVAPPRLAALTGEESAVVAAGLGFVERAVRPLRLGGSKRHGADHRSQILEHFGWRPCHAAIIFPRRPLRQPARSPACDTLARMATIRMRARAVAAFRGEFTDSGWEFHDVGVALDEIAALRPASDPIVLRVTSEPDSEPAAWAASVLGEWLCEADGSEPKRLGSVMLPGSDWVWWLGPSPLSGWEGCDEPILPLRIALAAGVDHKKIASAVGSRMRLWTSFNDPSNRRCRRAIRLVESWTQGKSDADGVIAAGEAATSKAWSIQGTQ